MPGPTPDGTRIRTPRTLSGSAAPDPSEDDEECQAPGLQSPDAVVVPACQPRQDQAYQARPGAAVADSDEGRDREHDGPEGPVDAAHDAVGSHPRRADLPQHVPLPALVGELLGRLGRNPRVRRRRRTRGRIPVPAERDRALIAEPGPLWRPADVRHRAPLPAVLKTGTRIRIPAPTYAIPV